MDEEVREFLKKWKASAWVGPGLVFAGVMGAFWIHLLVVIPMLFVLAVWDIYRKNAGLG